jgi:hypothetical protein
VRDCTSISNFSVVIEAIQIEKKCASPYTYEVDVNGGLEGTDFGELSWGTLPKSFVGRNRNGQSLTERSDGR